MPIVTWPILRKIELPIKMYHWICFKSLSFDFLYAFSKKIYLCGKHCHSSVIFSLNSSQERVIKFDKLAEMIILTCMYTWGISFTSMTRIPALFLRINLCASWFNRWTYGKAAGQNEWKEKKYKNIWLQELTYFPSTKYKQDHR